MNTVQTGIVNRYFEKYCKEPFEIIFTTRNVYAYRYKETWNDADLEGRLYLLKCIRNTCNNSTTDNNTIANNNTDIIDFSYKIIILHKKKPVNFEVSDSSIDSIIIDGNLIIFKIHNNPTKLGIWFEKQADADTLYKYIKRVN